MVPNETCFLLLNVLTKLSCSRGQTTTVLIAAKCFIHKSFFFLHVEIHQPKVLTVRPGSATSVHQFTVLQAKP